MDALEAKRRTINAVADALPFSEEGKLNWAALYQYCLVDDPLPPVTKN